MENDESFYTIDDFEETSEDDSEGYESSDEIHENPEYEDKSKNRTEIQSVKKSSSPVKFAIPDPSKFTTSEDLYPRVRIQSRPHLLEGPDNKKVFTECLELGATPATISPREWKSKFQESLLGFRQHSMELKVDCKNLDEINRYDTYKLSYSHADVLQRMVNNFCTFPLHGVHKIINVFNQTFGETVLNGWALNAVRKERTNTEYNSKVLSGTSQKTLTDNKKALDICLKKFGQVDSKSISLIKGGWSLFPYYYLPGIKSYG